MPHSEQKTHPYMIQHIKAMQWDGELSVLDCGVGAGWMARCVREAAGNRKVEITGLEIYLPYFVDWTYRSHLKACGHDLYDTIIAGDMGDMYTFLRDRCAEDEYDVIIFGDSLEHLREDKAEETFYNAQRAARRAVYVNAPITEYPQGPKMGNAAEAHQLQWKQADWEGLGLRHLGGSWAVGAFVWEAKA